MNLRRLEQLIALAEEGSFVRAAERTHLSQPALTRSIQHLEHDLGIRLFDRTRQGVVPTAAGQQLVDRARRVLFEVRGLVTQFRTEAGVAKAVDGVDFDIYEGEVLGIVGESGCGKSTLGRMVAGILEPTAGEIHYKGQAVRAMDKAAGRETALAIQILGCGMNDNIRAQRQRSLQRRCA